MIELEYPEETLPSNLKTKIYRCDVTCYNDKYKDDLERGIAGIPITEIFKVSANKINRKEDTLYPARQTFYVSNSSKMDVILERMIAENAISSIKVGFVEDMVWDEFYNIQINDEGEVLKFHKTA